MPKLNVISSFRRAITSINSSARPLSAELLLDCNAAICHGMLACNSGCEHLYKDGARASA
jgi:hypothetical protein